VGSFANAFTHIPRRLDRRTFLTSN
jgi:hypothetical protein